MTRRRRHPSLIPLSHQHRDALGLAFRLHHPSPPGPATAMTPPSTPQSRASETLAFFTAHLIGHFRAEETALFPFLRARQAGDAAGAALLDQLVADHRQLEAIRDQVAAAVDEAALIPILVAFADLLEAHVRREERELFEQLPDEVSSADADALAAAIRDALALPDPGEISS
jgi:hemerythrin-like domain-containing protein